MIEFFIGLHDPHLAASFDRCMISINRLRRRKGDFRVGRWMLDSGAFTELDRYGGYRHPVEAYAEEIARWAHVGELVAAVAQDYMCEPFMLAKTGLSLTEHQALTIERYDALRALVPYPYVLPVLQGYAPTEYVDHIRAYGDRLRHRAWVGVGSVCKRNADPDAIVRVLAAIKGERPDLRLHGFGIKRTALSDPRVRGLLASADSMAWSFHARMHGRDGNSVHEAELFRGQVEAVAMGPAQPLLA